MNPSKVNLPLAFLIYLQKSAASKSAKKVKYGIENPSPQPVTNGSDPPNSSSSVEEPKNPSVTKRSAI